MTYRGEGFHDWWGFEDEWGQGGQSSQSSWWQRRGSGGGGGGDGGAPWRGDGGGGAPWRGGGRRQHEHAEAGSGRGQRLQWRPKRKFGVGQHELGQDPTAVPPDQVIYSTWPCSMADYPPDGYQAIKRFVKDLGCTIGLRSRATNVFTDRACVLTIKGINCWDAYQYALEETMAHGMDMRLARGNPEGAIMIIERP